MNSGPYFDISIFSEFNVIYFEFKKPNKIKYKNKLSKTYILDLKIQFKNRLAESILGDKIINLAFGFSIIFFFTIESICCMQAPICQVFAFIKYKLFNLSINNIGEKKLRITVNINPLINLRSHRRILQILGS